MPWATRRAGSSAGGYALRVGVYFAALFTVHGITLPYFPVWLDWCGLDASEVAIITAAPFFARLAVTPALAMLADRLANHRLMTLVMGWVALAAVLVLSRAHGFAALLALSLLFMIALTTIMPLVEAVAVAGVKVRGLDYGRMRLWGSLSFILASAVGGALLGRWGAGAVIWLVTAGAAATALAAHLLPHPPAARVGEEWTGPERHPGLAWRLALSPLFLVFLLAAGAAQGAHAAFYTFGVLNWRAQGIGSLWTGALWAIGVLAEVAVFAVSGRLVRRFGALELLVAGAAAGVVRWTAMALDPPLALLVPLQVMHGLTYGAAHLGAIHFIGRAVPERVAGTAQALYGTVATGLAMGGATLAAGALYQADAAHSATGAYLAMALLALAGLLAALALRRRWTGGVLWAEAAGEQPSPTARVGAH